MSNFEKTVSRDRMETLVIPPFCEKKLLDLFLSARYRRFYWSTIHNTMGFLLSDFRLEDRKLAKDEREVLRCEN